ncbi:hypothetical protein AB2T61_08565 [Clostridium butyricum]
MVDEVRNSTRRYKDTIVNLFIVKKFMLKSATNMEYLNNYKTVG